MANGFVYFQSTDGGAPTLNGQQGSLINVLDWIIDRPSAPYKWTKEFSGTNKAVYRAPEGDRLYLQIQDDRSASGSANAENTRYALARMFDTMSDVDTGTNPVPTAGQVTSFGSLFASMCWIKSNTIDTTARAYCGIITSRFFILLTDQDGTRATNGWAFHFFGDMAAWSGGSDSYGTLIMGSRGTAANGSGCNQGLAGIGDNRAKLFQDLAAENLSSTPKMFARAAASGGTLGSTCCPMTWGLSSGARSTAVIGRAFSLPVPVCDLLGTTTTYTANSYPRFIFPHLRVMSVNSAEADTFSEGSRNFVIRRCRELPVALALEITNTDPNYAGF